MLLFRTNQQFRDKQMPTSNWNLNATVQIQTVVSSQGDSTNNVATLAIISAGQTVWTATMIQTANIAVVQSDLKIGSGDNETTIRAGSQFTLTVPTALMGGNMMASISFSGPGQPV